VRERVSECVRQTETEKERKKSEAVISDSILTESGSLYKDALRDSSWFVMIVRHGKMFTIACSRHITPSGERSTGQHVH
jgi:hypothetical protein